jgi:uncharacterized protein (DUF4415 family)
MADKPVTLDDPDNPEWAEADFARARPAYEILSPDVIAAFRRARGRPKSEAPKRSIKLRLDPDVVEAFKEQGRGWQSRMNTALRAAAGLGPKGS